MDDQDSGNTLQRTSRRQPPRTERSPWRSGRQRPGVYREHRAQVPQLVDGFPEERGEEFGSRRDTLSRRALALSDLIAAVSALVLAVELVGNAQLSFWPALAAAPLLTLVMKAAGLYDRDENLLRKTTLDEAPALLAVASLYAFCIWLVAPFVVDGGMRRAEVVALAALSFVLLAAGRVLMRALTVAGTAPERCIVIGGASAAQRVADKLGSVHGVRAELVGRVPLPGERRASERGGTVPVLGDMAGLGLVIAGEDIERAIIAFEGPDSEELLGTIRLVKALGVKVTVLPRLLEVVGSAASYDDLDGLPLLGVRRYGLSRSSHLLKRSLDVVGASLALLVVAPLFLVAAVAIKLDSRGPVFFRQRRVGRGSKTFDMFKFRSMVAGADGAKEDLRDRNEAVGLFKIERDPRITRVGKLLRATSVDELPQLVNVLKGDMSLVGPRPLVPDEDRMIEGWQRRRLNFRPGMTGMWQVFGASRIPMHEMVKIDYLYGANWSLWGDLKILARTVPVVLGRRGL
jgi:exopolysaccharide biosynthesis polyprenyl glycosylphosphotransferase